MNHDIHNKVLIKQRNILIIIFLFLFLSLPIVDKLNTFTYEAVYGENHKK